MTVYLLVLMLSWLSSDGRGIIEKTTVVAQFNDPYDCQSYQASLTGFTREHEYLVCIPAESSKK
jgi:hypothetical protein